MKKRLLAFLLILNLSILGLAACGDSKKPAETEKAAAETTVETEAPETEAPETEAAETEAAETEVPETEAPETEAPETEAPETEAAAVSEEAALEDWIGEWTAVKAKAQSAIITGDLTNLDMSFTMSLHEDQTAAVTFGEDQQECTWQKGEGRSAVIVADENQLPMTLNDAGQIEFDMSMDGEEAIITFAKGTDPEPVISYDYTKAVPITDTAVLEGSWKAIAANYLGACIEGDLSAFGDFDMKLQLNADGTGILTSSGSDSDITWSSDESGVSLKETKTGITIPMTQLDDHLVIDMSSLFDGMYLILSK